MLLRCLAFLLRVSAIATAGVASLHAQNPAVFVKISSDQLAANATPTAATTITVAAPGSGWTYSAAAPFAGTTWNVVNRPNPLIQSNVTNGVNGTYVLGNINNLSLVDSTGTSTAVTLTGSIVIADLESGSTRTEPSSATGSADATLGPKGLSEKPWRIYRGGNSTIFKFSGLTAGANYYVFFYGSTTDARGSIFTLDSANDPSGNTANAIHTSGSTGGNLFVSDGTTITTTTPAVPNTVSAAGQNTVWGRLHAVVAGDGSLTFRTGKNAQNNQYFSGVQLIPYPLATISVQPPATPAATVGSTVNISVSASGDGTLTYQWRKDGVAIAGNASATTDTLTLANVQNSDAASYDLVITNPGGSVTSTASVLSVGTSSIVPSITAQPANQTAVVGAAASFSITANGTSPLSVQWQKSNDNVAFADISGATSTLLSISTAQTSDAGYYRAVVTNSVGTATSNAATLTVAPTITTQPVSTVVTAGATHTISVVTDAGAGAPEPTTYVWKRDGTTITDTAGISGATTADIQITAFSATHSGYYTVTASNSAGSVTSSSVYVGIPSTQTTTFAPGNNATGLSIDQQLRLVFPSAPKLGQSGALRIHDASNDAVVVTIDRAQLVTYTLFSATVVNGATQTLQGKATYYMPVAIYGNEVWLTLPAAQRLAYGKTYYVTMDAGFLLDSTNAVVPAITSTTAWRFSTKASGPATPTASTGPAEITVGLDGTGDFATIQGASDWIPQNNTLPRTIRVKPGVYRDLVYFAQNRNFVTLVGDGATRQEVKILYHYPAEVYAGGARGFGSLRIESHDVTVRNLTVDDEVYLAQPSLAGGSHPSAPAFAGPIQTVATTGRRLVFDNVLIKGGQDTLYTITGIAYFKNCEIWGSVDFIYGDALAVFDSCDIVQIRATGGPICAPSTPYAQPYGEVFLNCRFPRALVANGYPYDVGVNTTTFCRPWRQDGMVAVINSQLDTHITTKGWGEWDGRENTMRAREYGNTLFAGGPAPTAAERQAAGGYWVNTIDPDYTTSSMSPTDPLLAAPNGILNRQPVTVDPADYTLAAIFGHPYFALDGWLPSVLTTAPVFSTQPASQTINTGASATFTAAASGSPTYQWKKDNVDIPGATGVSYTVSNANTSSAGSYTVVATNVGGSTTSDTAVLTVNATTGPLIATQPSSQTVTVGAAASFTVAATGTGTLTYQWQKEIAGVFTNVPFVFAQNDPAIVTDFSGIATPTLSFVHAQVINAGNYRVLVTDSTGTTPSNTVTFTVNTTPVGALTFDGFAASVTGGGSLTPVVVTTAAALKAAAEATAPAVITVSGVIDLGTNGRISVKSNKTIRGADTGATIIGGLSLSNVTNVIVANLNITAPTGARGSNDGMTIGSGSTNILITKCTFFDCTDGNLDVVNGSDLVTISWCKFYYTRNTTHNFSNLIGSSDTDVVTSQYRVTWHHNWWGPGCKQRMLACRFGGAHMFNNYWSCTGNDYCSTSRNIAQLLSEYNVYDSVKDPLAKEGSATLKTIGNVFTNCTGKQTVSNDTVFTPPYAYRVDRTSDIQTLVTAGAGNTGTAAPAAESLAITGATSVATGGSITLTASGYVSYQWRFNNEAIVGATSATYTIASAQSADAGTYTVIGSFSGRPDSVVSTPHTLTVTTGSVAVPPSIATQPTSQTANVGAAASFTVAASGDAPLTYQWQKDISGTFTSVSGATSATLAFASAQLSDAGSYRVIVTNGTGTATSSTATLTVNSANFAVTGPDGFANATTGGGSLTPIVVTTAADFKTAVESSSPAVITVSGTLTLSGGQVAVRSNKTIQGADGFATIIGCLNLGGGNVTNVIIRGLNITNPGPSGDDGITVRNNASNIFITHCTLFDCADGMIDINNGADNVTVSWCEFYYTPAQTDHRFTMIVGSAGAETKPLHITLHHNWWSDRCDQRMPSGTFGYVHLYNNYFTAVGNSYATNARATSQFFIEHSVYAGVKDPMYKEGGGLMRSIGNVFTATTGMAPDVGTDTIFTPPYSYKLQPTTSSAGLDVASLVMAHAGNTDGLNSTSPAVLTATITGSAQTIPPGGSSTLTASFTGFTAASYQWRLNNFPISAATSATYELTGMDSTKAGAYTVAIALATGETVVSTPFAVAVGTATAPTITTQPANVTVTAGASASFSVVATGSPAPTYQWRKAGVNISGATAATYTIAATAASDAGQYTVVVTNDAGSITSNAATLTVNAVPPTPPPSSGGGGGGGGGAPSLWFMGALAFLFAMRRAFRRC